VTDVVIKNRWNDEPIELPDDCPQSSIKVILEWCARRAREGEPSANLTRANLYGANLYGANLTRANLTRANLYGANLDGANLYGANLYGANLDGANLDGARHQTPGMTLLANWASAPDGLVVEAVLIDMANHPNPIPVFREWAAGGGCPFSSDEWLQSVGGIGNGRHREIVAKNIDVLERRLKFGKPWSMLRLAEALIDACCKKENHD